jgi:radical SAM superfamily enzyme YgiQ (UPF0313 family)
LCIGFQTISRTTTKDELILHNNVDDYKKLVDLLHKYKILVDGTFIFGFDTDDKDIFSDTEELIRYLGLDTYIFYFLTPYPGTEYFNDFSKEGRLLSSDWTDFDWDHVVVEPRNMTEHELRDGVQQLYKRLDKTYLSKHLAKNIRKFRIKLLSKDLFPFLLSLWWHYRRSSVSQR